MKNSIYFSCTAIIIFFTFLFVAVSCGENDPLQEGQKSAYTYKAVVVGSTGNIKMALTPSEPDKKGTGEITLILDGQSHLLQSNSLDSWVRGTPLDLAWFTNSDKTIAAGVSVDQDGGNPKIALSAEGHSNIVVRAYLSPSENDVEVYEGTMICHIEGSTETYSESTYNVIMNNQTHQFLAIEKMNHGPNSSASRNDQYTPSFSDGQCKKEGKNMIFNAFVGGHTLSSSFVSHDNFLTLEYEKRNLMVGNQVVREGHAEEVLGETSTLITQFKLKKTL